MKKRYIIGLILITTLLYSGDIENKKILEDTPIDEGVENRPKEDKVKGAVFATDKEAISLKLYLSKEKDNISIKFKKVSRVPFIYKIIRDNKVIFESEPKKPKSIKDRTLEFKIDKSKLKSGDTIKIFNRRDRVVGIIEIFN
jgi:hypothetical protein